MKILVADALSKRNKRRLRDDTKKQSDNEKNRRHKAFIRGDQETYAKERMLENERRIRNKNNYKVLVEIYEIAIIDTSDKNMYLLWRNFFQSIR